MDTPHETPPRETYRRREADFPKWFDAKKSRTFLAAKDMRKKPVYALRKEEKKKHDVLEKMLLEGMSARELEDLLS